MNLSFKTIVMLLFLTSLSSCAYIPPEANEPQATLNIDGTAPHPITYVGAIWGVVDNACDKLDINGGVLGITNHANPKLQKTIRAGFPTFLRLDVGIEGAQDGDGSPKWSLSYRFTPQPGKTYDATLEVINSSAAVSILDHDTHQPPPDEVRVDDELQKVYIKDCRRGA